MANGETTQRSELDADSVTRVLREHAAAVLADEPEVTLILDGMDLRRKGAASQQALMQVKALDGGLVNGHRSLNMLGLGEDEVRGCCIIGCLAAPSRGLRVRTAKFNRRWMRPKPV